MLAAAVAVTALWAAAGALTTSPARATPPAGVTTEILGRGTTLAGFIIHAAGIKVESNNAADITVARLTFAPCGTSGWYACPGPVLVVVTTGSVTRYSAGDCTAQTYIAGQAFAVHGPADKNLVRNNGSVPAETIVTFLTPPGAPLRGDTPPPPGCYPEPPPAAPDAAGSTRALRSRKVNP